jgi:hypothetical protein
MLAVVDETLANLWVMLEQRRRAIANEKIDGRPGHRAPEVTEQRRCQHDVAQSAQLHEKHLARLRNAGRHSGSRHSFAYCTNA